MIVGLGLDITEVKRIEAVIGEHGQRFLDRIYAPGEIAYCRRFRVPYERYAARFAAKEAAMKALGTGWSSGVRWVDIEVTRLPGGKPTLALHGATAELARCLGVRNISVSLTHTSELAFAQVIFED